MPFPIYYNVNLIRIKSVADSLTESEYFAVEDDTKRCNGFAAS